MILIYRIRTSNSRECCYSGRSSCSSNGKYDKNGKRKHGHVHRHYPDHPSGETYADKNINGRHDFHQHRSGHQIINSGGLTDECSIM